MWRTLRSIVQAISAFVRNSEESVTNNHEGSDHAITLLALLAEDQDRSVVSGVCSGNHWDVSFATTVEEAGRTSGEVKPQVVLFDRDLAGSGWREAVSTFAALWPRACIMLISRVKDDYLWNEVVSNGGYDILPKPLRADEVCRVVKLAWCYWSSTTSKR